MPRETPGRDYPTTADLSAPWQYSPVVVVPESTSRAPERRTSGARDARTSCVYNIYIRSREHEIRVQNTRHLAAVRESVPFLDHAYTDRSIAIDARRLHLHSWRFGSNQTYVSTIYVYINVHVIFVFLLYPLLPSFTPEPPPSIRHRGLSRTPFSPRLAPARHDYSSLGKTRPSADNIKTLGRTLMIPSPDATW